MRRALMLSAALAAAGCTDTSLYVAAGDVPLEPDRMALSGKLCTENPAGERFAVKVLLMVDTTAAMFSADPDVYRICGGVPCAPGSLQALIERSQSLPNVHFGFATVARASRALPPPDGQRFFRPHAPEVAQAVALMHAQETNGSGARDISAAVAQLEAFIQADIARTNPGEVLRTRYIVTMLLAGPPEGVGVATDPEYLARQVERVREQVHAQGALELTLNIGLVYHGPSSIDPNGYHCYAAGGAAEPACACDAGVHGGSGYCNTYCDLQAGIIDEQRNADARAVYGAMAFTGGGRFREIACPAAVSWEVNLVDPGARLVKKDIVAFNRNVHLRNGQPVIDSDGDGLSDAEERAATPASDPLLPDTDGDGLSDFIEFRAYPRQSPVDPGDRPASCLPPGELSAVPDRDADLLNDCEEGIVQTSPSIPDTDGDGLPDLLELLAGTIPTSSEDRLLDFDGDGIANGEEVLSHTNPRSNDGSRRGRCAYRHEVVALGVQKVAMVTDAPQLQAVSFRSASGNLAGGQGFMRWDACGRELSFSDARVDAVPPCTPVPVPITQSGVVRLTATCAGGEEIWIEVAVNEPLLPDCAEQAEVVTRPLVIVAERTCYDVRITNIKLMQTAATAEHGAGHNEILVFFTQGAEGRPQAPGIAQVASIPVTFICGDGAEQSTCRRDPAAPLVELSEADFVSR